MSTPEGAPGQNKRGYSDAADTPVTERRGKQVPCACVLSSEQSASAIRSLYEDETEVQRGSVNALVTKPGVK